MDSETPSNHGERLQELEARVSKLEKILHERPTTALAKPASPAETFRSLGVQTNVDRVFGAAVQMELVDGQTPYHKEDLEKTIRLAKQPLPGNTNEAVNGLVRKGLLMEDAGGKDGLKAWELTQAGIDRARSMLDEAE